MESGEHSVPQPYLDSFSVPRGCSRWVYPNWPGVPERQQSNPAGDMLLNLRLDGTGLSGSFAVSIDQMTIDRC
jgi:hypothetical protein